VRRGYSARTVTRALSAYHRLEARFRRIRAIGDAEAVLHWDLATMMPKGGASARADQLAVLKSLRHEILTHAETAALLAEAEADSANDLDDWQRANLAEMARAHAHATALTPDLVEAASRAASACETAWREAKAEKDFSLVRAPLDALLARVRDVATAKAERLGLSPYDALLDEYEPGGRSAEIDRHFARLSALLPDVLRRAQARQAGLPAVPEPQGPFPIDVQRRLAIALMERLGFDFHHGRLDVSLHPFCGGTPDDVRITTRYNEEDFRPALMGVLHETGHALYERGLPERWRGQPVGEARGMVLHESQSLLIEMQVCRSREFLSFLAPLLRDAFGDDPAWHAEALFRYYTRVQPSFIRVDADEVTYPAHVILRYRLERALLAGDLPVIDLPEAWNAGMQELLGLRPPDDSLGCLQDIHWYDGAWGYFPTYTLGAMAAAQLYAAACAAEPDVPAALRRGDFAPLLSWLRTHVHAAASRYSTHDLLLRATGRPLDTEAFEAHLARRYLD
jgi:carboxypeptidase Taq